MQKYVGAVIDVCGSGRYTNFLCDPQFGDFRNIVLSYYNTALHKFSIFLVCCKNMMKGNAYLNKFDGVDYIRA
jgi:hypothetical protein